MKLQNNLCWLAFWHVSAVFIYFLHSDFDFYLFTFLIPDLCSVFISPYIFHIVGFIFDSLLDYIFFSLLQAYIASRRLQKLFIDFVSFFIFNSFVIILKLLTQDHNTQLYDFIRLECFS